MTDEYEVQSYDQMDKVEFKLISMFSYFGIPILKVL